MRIDRMILTAFGRFQGRTIDLGPGLTIIYGENESGKSTIQKFLLGMLYGFKKRGLRREYTEDAARYRPWAGEEYRGALLYTLDGGQAYRVERVFDPSRESVRLYDAVTGADLTRSFAMDRRKELLFAEEQLRLSAEVFTSTAWVGQMEVGRLEMGRELVQRVANLSESGREDLSVRTALRILDERIREIGSERAPTRPYARVTRLIGEKRQELERAQRTRQQTLEWEAGLREARSEVARLEREIQEAQRRLVWAQLAEAEERLERVQLSTAKMQAARLRTRELAGFAFFPVELRSALKECQAQIDQSRAAIERYRQRQAELDGAREALEAQLGEYAGLVALGPEAAAEVAAAARRVEGGQSRLSGLREETARLDELIARLDETMEPLAAVAREGEERLAQVERLEREVDLIKGRLDPGQLERLRAAVGELERRHRAGSGTGWLALALLLLAAGASAPFVPAPAAGLPVAGGLALLGLLSLIPFLLVRRSRGRVATDLEEAKRQLKLAESAWSEDHDRIRRLEKQREQVLQIAGVLTAGELRNQMLRYEQLAARREGQEVRREALLAEIRQLEEESAAEQARLREMLSAGLGLPPAEVRPDPEAVARFQERARQVSAARFELEALQREARELAERIAEEERQIAVAQAEYEAVLGEAGVPDAEAFEAGCASHEEWRKAEREAEGLRVALSALLGEEDGESVGREVERLRQQAVGPKPEALPAAAAVAAEIRQLEAQRAEWHARASDLAARVETAVAEIADTADLEREIQALVEERQQMEEELAALELARSVIGEVSSQIHREFAPRLNQAMGRIASQLTRGRYQAVRIDEDLTIRAIAEGERTVELTSLSGGTVDQFYLALRVAILDLLTEGQERIPLLLDDPFVQYDSERLRSAMAYLGRLAADRQVVLMTCHQREVEMGRELGAHLIEL
ncbi:MAG: AAA family ATPase [Bacillota bacterium]